MTHYLEELRSGWRPLAAAVIGLSGGMVIIAYVFGIFAPYLIAEFGWSKSQFALVGLLASSAIFLLPLVGRLTDMIGVRKSASIGVLACPAIFLGFATIDSLLGYAVIYALQASVLVTTTNPVYCRLVVQHFERARGLALGITAAGPAVTIAVGGPLLNNLVADHGWRSGCDAMAIFTGLMGCAALLLMPPRKDEAATLRPKMHARQDYGWIFRRPAFWIIIAAILLCNLPQPVMMTQLTLVLSENGVSGKDASVMISAYAGGMLIGRLLSGVALDRFPAPLVATASMILSGIGLLALASGYDAPAAILVAVLLFGLSTGAEGDVIAYLVVQNFGVRIYSSVYGMIASVVAITAVIGTLFLSVMLKLYELYQPFLLLTGILILVGSVFFLLLPRDPVAEEV